MRLRFCFLVLAVVAPLTSPATAQEVRVGATKSWTSHEVLGDPVGLDVLLGVRVWGRLGLQLGYGQSRDDFETFGTTCQGLASPDMDCDDERRSDRSRVRTLSVSAPVALHRGERMTVALVPGWQTASVSTVQEGNRTGRLRLAEESIAGFEIGANLRWRLSPDWPVHLDFTGSISRLAPRKERIIADGYTPFNDSVRVRRLGIGISVVR